MRVFVNVFLLVALVAAEPPLYRQLKVDFEIDDEPFSEINEDKNEDNPPYPAAGFKPFKEFRLPHRFEKRLPLLRSELPSRQNILFRKVLVPQTQYGFPEGNKERIEGNDNKKSEERTNTFRNSYEAPVHHHNLPTQYGTPEKEENFERNSENFENGLEVSEESSKVKIDESTENSNKEDKQERPENNERYTENNVEIHENGNIHSREANEKSGQEKERKTDTERNNNVEIHEEGKLRSRDSNEKEGQKRERKTEKERENVRNEEKSEEDSNDQSVQRPYYILVQSTPTFDVPYQKPIPLPTVYEGIPFQRQTDFSNIGYSSFYQQRAVDSTPFSYYLQPKFQQYSNIVPNTGNQWTNQW
ncbi:hypothetical protein O0L34_g5677 [Tuta absoluta]|nr:hypothetical protein O0L34_g5677 [Tuta absoluta]